MRLFILEMGLSSSRLFSVLLIQVKRKEYNNRCLHECHNISSSLFATKWFFFRLPHVIIIPTYKVTNLFLSKFQVAIWYRQSVFTNLPPHQPSEWWSGEVVRVATLPSAESWTSSTWTWLTAPPLKTPASKWSSKIVLNWSTFSSGDALA